VAVALWTCRIAREQTAAPPGAMPNQQRRASSPSCFQIGSRLPAPQLRPEPARASDRPFRARLPATDRRPDHFGSWTGRQALDTNVAEARSCSSSFRHRGTPHRATRDSPPSGSRLHLSPASSGQEGEQAFRHPARRLTTCDVIRDGVRTCPRETCLGGSGNWPTRSPSRPSRKGGSGSGPRWWAWPRVIRSITVALRAGSPSSFRKALAEFQGVQSFSRSLA